ncbi:MAG: hypothetical protein KC933_11360 [Myxococcales bacterium]|nr:hypothetical protein [Myxococcales bacterium]
MHAVALVVPLTLLAGSASGATPVVPGEVYPAGTRVAFPSLGLSFVIPDAFQGGLSPNGSVFLMGSDSEQGLVVGLADEGVTADALVEELSRPIPIDASTSLQPSGRAKQKGAEVSNRYSVRGDRGFAGWARARLFEGGVAVAFISLAPDAKAARRRLDAVFDGLQVLPKPRPAASASPWAARLAGNTLTYMKTKNGLSTKLHFQLCPDGRFLYSGSDGYLSGGFSASGRSSDQGTWSLEGDTLTFTWADGSVDRRTLTADGGKTFLNGVRWFVESGTNCN